MKDLYFVTSLSRYFKQDLLVALKYKTCLYVCTHINYNVWFFFSPVNIKQKDTVQRHPLEFDCFYKKQSYQMKSITWCICV